jgi:hypothetical protein
MVDVHDQLNATQRARITGLCAIRDHARALLDAQLRDESDSQMATCGPCSTAPTTALSQARLPVHTGQRAGVPARPGLSAAAVAGALRRRVGHGPQGGAVHAAHADAGGRTDGRGRADRGAGGVDAMAWAGRSGLHGAAAWGARTGGAGRAGRSGQVFLDPADGEWKTADDYLSGNVKAKLKQAVLSGAAYRATSRRWNRCSPKTCCRRPSSRVWGRCGFRRSRSRRSSRKFWS